MTGPVGLTQLRGYEERKAIDGLLDGADPARSRATLHGLLEPLEAEHQRCRHVPMAAFPPPVVVGPRAGVVAGVAHCRDAPNPAARPLFKALTLLI